MSILEKLENFKLKNLHQDTDVNFLNDQKFCLTLNSALSELYRVQPKNPVSFLANYLLNEHRSTELIEIQEEKQKIKIQSIIQYEQKQNNYTLLKQGRDKKIEIYESEKAKLLNEIKASEDLEAILDRVCDTLKKLVNATGVYISYYERKRKPITEQSQDDDHLDDYDVIRFVAYDKDHSFLKGLYLESKDNKEGVTYSLYEEENKDGTDMDEVPNKEEIKNIYIKEVIRENKIKFFKEPRLGCYLALNISYESSKSLESLSSALLKWEEFQQEKIRIQEEKIEKEKQKKEEMEMGGDNDGDEEEIQKEAVLADFDKKEKRVIIALDTLGQDRLFTKEEYDFINLVALNIKNSFYELEKKLLIKDRDLKLNSIEEQIKFFEENKEEKIKEYEDIFRKEYIITKYGDSPPTSDEEKKFVSDFSKFKYIVTEILRKDNFLNKDILNFAKYEVNF